MGSVIGQEAVHGTANAGATLRSTLRSTSDEVDPVDLELASMVAVYSLMRSARREPGAWHDHPVRASALNKVLTAVGGEHGFTVRCDQHRLSKELVTVCVKWGSGSGDLGSGTGSRE